MILDSVKADVCSQLDQQGALGIQVTALNDVPENGPTNRGLWNQINDVTAVFVDIKGSTQLNAYSEPDIAARIYTYFVRTAAVMFDRFSARYVDIQGDGVFGLFSGSGSMFNAAASAITIRTFLNHDVARRIRKECKTDWKLTVGVGVDRGTLLVRRLGLRDLKQNEVWAGKPVNTAAKLSSIADLNNIVVSDRVFKIFEQSSKLRQRVLLWSCGCQNGLPGLGLNAAIGKTTYLWTDALAPSYLGLDFDTIFKLETEWCSIHGSEFCEALITGKVPPR